MVCFWFVPSTQEQNTSREHEHGRQRQGAASRGSTYRGPNSSNIVNHLGGGGHEHRDMTSKSIDIVVVGKGEAARKGVGLSHAEKGWGRGVRLACLCTGLASLVLILVALVLELLDRSWFPLVLTAAAFVLQVGHSRDFVIFRCLT